MPVAKIAKVKRAEVKELNLYVSFPPVTSSVPCLVVPGRMVCRVRERRYQPRTAPVASQDASPLKPGHPVSRLRVSRVKAEGMSVDGTGQPEMSLQRKVRV